MKRIGIEADPQRQDHPPPPWRSQFPGQVQSGLFVRFLHEHCDDDAEIEINRYGRVQYGNDGQLA
jgi:hypothetical protein